jgi:hypothetical protein
MLRVFSFIWQLIMGFGRSFSDILSFLLGWIESNVWKILLMG